MFKQARALLGVAGIAAIAAAGPPEAAVAQGTAASVSRAVQRSIPAAPDPRHVFVLDSAHLFTEAEVAAMQDSATALQAQSGADVAFVTLPTLHGGAVEEAAREIGRGWKMGSAGAPGDPTRNRGVVLLYVRDKKGVAGGNLRVEVGQGLEGAITDGGGSREILEAMKPKLRAKHYGEGFLSGFVVAARLVRNEQKAVPRTVGAPAAQPLEHDRGTMIGIVVILLIFAALAILIIVKIVQAARAAALAGPPTMTFNRTDDDEPQRPSDGGGPAWGDWGGSSDSSSSSSSSGGDSSGGSFGGGGGFSGGGASDSV